MNAEFFEAIEDIEKEKGIPRAYMYGKIEQAMLTAFRRDNPECEDNVQVLLDEEKKQIEMVVNKTVVSAVEDPSHDIKWQITQRLSKTIPLLTTILEPRWPTPTVGWKTTPRQRRMPGWRLSVP